MQNARIYHSVVGLRSWVAEGAVIEDALLMGADYYEVRLLASTSRRMKWINSFL